MAFRPCAVPRIAPAGVVDQPNPARREGDHAGHCPRLARYFGSSAAIWATPAGGYDSLAPRRTWQKDCCGSPRRRPDRAAVFLNLQLHILPVARLPIDAGAGRGDRCSEFAGLGDRAHQRATKASSSDDGRIRGAVAAIPRALRIVPCRSAWTGRTRRSPVEGDMRQANAIVEPDAPIAKSTSARPAEAASAT